MTTSPDTLIDVAKTDGQTLSLRLMGNWTMADHPPSGRLVGEHIAADPDVRHLALSGEDVGKWDSALISFLVAAKKVCDAASVAIDMRELPAGAEKLVKLATAVPEKAGARRDAKRPPPLTVRLGTWGLGVSAGLGNIAGFVGEAALSFGRLFTGRARLRRSDLLLLMQETGAQALPIVSLISVLVGMILAFVGAVQLEQFGAGVYVANLVAIATAREMGAMMTAIIMAGRTGAAFAAQIGTMRVNQEVDALETFSIPPMDFLVLPRMTALLIMMPLLTLYANLLGILGGAIVGIGMLNISPLQYFYQTQASVHVSDFAFGLVKSSIFGAIIAVAGCMRGIQCGRSAAAVGQAATSAVVLAIIGIVVADGLFAVLANVLGI